ncbi:MAG: LysE family translocator [Alcanivorax sp.]|nr:LysE family translocator [Alcanivorax sp.]
MMVLAALPSTSVALVVVRSARLGVAHGLWVAAGIVMADLLFAALALWGMAELAQQLGGFFALVRIAAGFWLVWFGISLIRSRGTALQARPITGSSKTVSFLAGLAVTLGDIKAIVFYASLFPLFVDMYAPDVAHLVAVLLITVFSVGGVKAVYALLAQRITRRSNPRLQQPLNTIAGCAMVGAGTWLVIRP